MNSEHKDDSDMKKLDSLLKEATEPNVPEGYWEKLSQDISRKTEGARTVSFPKRAPRILAFFQWSAAAAAIVLLAVSLHQIVVLRDKVAGITQTQALTAQRTSDDSMRRWLDSADTGQQITAALAIDEFLGGRATILATDGGDTQIQTAGLWSAVRERPINVSFAVFKKVDDKMVLVSSPTIAVLRGNEIKLRFRAKNEPISIEYECFDIAETPQGLLLPCRVSIVAASGYRCQISSSPYLREGSATKVGSVTAGNEQFEVFVNLQDDTQKAANTKI